MKQDYNPLIESFNSLRSGNFDHAFELAESEIKKDVGNFYAWYLAAVALAFLDQRKNFEHYLSRASGINPDYPFIVYLRAYINLWNNDVASALLEWTRIADLEEGWLARELIEKERKGVGLVEKANQGDISFFILIPDLKKEFFYDESAASVPDDVLNEIIEREKERSKPKEIQPSLRYKYKNNSRFNLLLKIFLPVLLALILFLLLKNPVIHWIKGSSDGYTEAMWKDLKIDEWAALINARNKDNIKYVYKEKEKLIEDFESAKKNLSAKKVNQSRFLLQRILYSNADFKTKEKSKIFLGFIPEPDYQDFTDPVFPEQILKTPEFYQDCLVLWQGSVLKIKEVDNGKEVRLLVRDSTQDYIVDAFLPTNESRSNWLPFSEYQKAQTISEKKPQAIVYGKFKGLIGAQKSIYLELVKLWM